MPSPKPTPPARPATSDQRHKILSTSDQAMRDHYGQVDRVFARAMEDRHDWEHATADFRRLAIAADAQLCRRHPALNIKPPYSAEPAAVSDATRKLLPLAAGLEARRDVRLGP